MLESIELASKKIGRHAGTLVSFAKISREQYDCFEREKQEERQRRAASYDGHHAQNLGCNVQ